MESHVDTREDAPTDDTAHFALCWPFMALGLVKAFPLPDQRIIRKSKRLS
jgi:hypothetical protein